MTFLIQEENPPEYYDDLPEEDIGLINKLSQIDITYKGLFKEE